MSYRCVRDIECLSLVRSDLGKALALSTRGGAEVTWKGRLSGECSCPCAILRLRTCGSWSPGSSNAIEHICRTKSVRKIGGWSKRHCGGKVVFFCWHKDCTRRRMPPALRNHSDAHARLVVPWYAKMLAESAPIGGQQLNVFMWSTTWVQIVLDALLQAVRFMTTSQLTFGDYWLTCWNCASHTPLLKAPRNLERPKQQPQGVAWK